MGTSKRYPAELRERAVRLVLEHRGEYPTEWGAITSIAEKFGVGSETLRSEVQGAPLQVPADNIWLLRLQSRPLGRVATGRPRSYPLRAQVTPAAEAQGGNVTWLTKIQLRYDGRRTEP
jgi:hypothetical protein